MFKKVIGLAVMAVLSNPLMADDRWSINAGGYYYLFDNDRVLEDKAGLGINAEKRFDNKGLRFGINGTDTEADWTNGPNIDVRVYQVDGLYYLTEHGNWQPYLLGGVAHAEFDRPGSTDREAQLSAGGGFRYALSDNWHWWAEARAVLGIDHDKSGDGVFATGLGYSFGDVARAEPTPAPAPAPVDSDGDGVTDDRDQCPDTPRGVAVDSVGCPLDSDGDGVPDYQDRCPDTPAGTKVDELGCHEVVEQAKLDVRFPLNSSVVDSRYLDDVKRVADFMKQYPKLTVTIEGHTDSQGADSYNQTLSDRRAANVADVLVNRFGIERSRVSHRGYGETRPVASNDTAEGRAQNRRVVAVVRTTIKQ